MAEPGSVEAPTAARQPAVTVVVPNYNYAHFLPECLDSMLAQTYEDWEVVVVDDGSTDGSAAVVERYVQAYPERFRLVRLAGGPSGTPRAVNAGVRVMRGRYFSWLSSDDRCAPGKLAACVDALERHPAAGMVYSGYHVVDGSGRRVNTATPASFAGVESFYRLLHGNTINGSTVLVRKDVLDEAGPLLETDPRVPDLWRSAEYRWWIEIALRSDVLAIDRPLHDWRVHSVNGPFNTSNIGSELTEVTRRRFVRDHCMDAIATRISTRSGGSRLEVYRRVTQALALAPRAGDVGLILDEYQKAGPDERRVIADTLDRLQHTITSCRSAHFYLANDDRLPAAVASVLDPDAVETRLLVEETSKRAQEALAAGAFDLAARRFRSLLAMPGASPRSALTARGYLALALERAGKADEAAEEFSAILAVEPRHATAQKGLERVRHGARG